MTVTVTWQTFITIGAVVSAIALLISYITKIVHWMDKQEEQSEEITKINVRMDELEKTRVTTVESITSMHNTDVEQIRQEQQLLVYCSLACLKGLKQLGADGEVSNAIEMIEKHVNQQAHTMR